MRRAAERLEEPRSQIVSEAIQDCNERIGRLSERQRLERLEAFEQVVLRIPQRSLVEVEGEIAEVRPARPVAWDASTRRTG